jgi:glycosyltransferase involved in cell wall biosynthesis
MADFPLSVGLLTGAQDPHYSHGLALALAARGVSVDFIGSDDLDGPALRRAPQIRFLNLRGSQRRDAGAVQKLRRVMRYYVRLANYAMVATPGVLHILWNNKFELLDRTVLMLYYRMCGRRIVLTAHNVNQRRRDGGDSLANRLTLKIQYRLCDHIFVHTDKMKRELVEEYGTSASRISVIPYGINNMVPAGTIEAGEAKARLGISPTDRTLLFYGQIGPYKGIDLLADAFETLARSDASYRLIIAGRPKPGTEASWREVQARLQPLVDQRRVVLDIRHIPDEDTERYFMAADLLVLPYRDIFQSGVLFLGYRYGLPVVATDVGSFREDVVEGRTGFLCPPENASELASAIDRYFASELFQALPVKRPEIRRIAEASHSWDTVAALTCETYAHVLGGHCSERAAVTT